MAAPLITISPRARQAYISFYAACRGLHSSVTCRQSSRGSFVRSDFSGQGFTGVYEPGGPTVGPLGDANAGEPFITPRVLKDHLDQFVVGQERAKKVLSVAVYNHYQRVQELQRREEEEQALYDQAARRADAARHPVEGEYPGQNATVSIDSGQGKPADTQVHPRYTTPPPTQSLLDPSSVPVIEKSNVLLLGPSGVGKTLMAKTLARVLEVPFSISDCTPFTQAGYIGEDVEVCVQRLLAASDYDVAKAERGIICLDEVDKIATAKVSHGKDVSGEGVQQALLKIIEGTTVQVQAKSEKSSNSGSPGRNAAGFNPSGSGSGAGNQTPQQQINKGDVYNVNTDNILFVCTGAFIGLHKMVMDRIDKGSMGFGARVRSTPRSLSGGKDTHDPLLPADKANEELFRKHLPFYSDVASLPSTSQTVSISEDDDFPSEIELPTFNSLDLTLPSDLQKYGLIPELIGRLPTVCALSPLSLQSLVRVLTEPRNSLVGQYIHLFSLSNITLHFTTPALWEIARSAREMGTGARGLRTGMERCLGEAMFDGPGSGARFCLVSEDVAKRRSAPLLFSKGESSLFQDHIKSEEDAWEERRRRAQGIEDHQSDSSPASILGVDSFEQYRQKVSVAGSG